MQRLTINNLGPIKECAIDVKDFMVFTGPQASGKSTIAKNSFFFNNLKNVLFSMCQKQKSMGLGFEPDAIENDFSAEIIRKFSQSFHLYTQDGGNGFVKYEYANGSTITVSFGSSGTIDTSSAKTKELRESL